MMEWADMGLMKANVDLLIVMIYITEGYLAGAFIVF
jgi:hypothetical protein